MKLKIEFVVKKVADKTVAIAVDPGDTGFSGMLTLNDSGAFIFSKLNEGTTEEKLLADFLSEYDATREQAESTINSFVAKLREAGLVED